MTELTQDQTDAMSGLDRWFLYRLDVEWPGGPEDEGVRLAKDGDTFVVRLGDLEYRSAVLQDALQATLAQVRRRNVLDSLARRGLDSLARRGLTLPCPACSGDGFVSFEDRHVESAKEACQTCGGHGVVLSNTGVTRESSCDPATGKPFDEVPS